MIGIAGFAVVVVIRKLWTDYASLRRPAFSFRNIIPQHL